MPRYKLTNKAVDDLAGIWNYTLEKWSEAQADKYYRMLVEAFEEVAIHPESGKKYPVVSENLFGFRAGRHIIFYRKPGETEVRIIRILHGQMDLKSRIREK
jgi:toxin ParE1/3/4